MARNRANATVKGNKIEVKEKPKYRPLIKGEELYFQELIDVSNRFATLQQQKEAYEFAVKKLETKRKKVQNNKIKMPILLPFIPKHSYYMEDNKKEVIKFLDEEINKLKSSVKSLEGQLQHRYDEYLESANRNKTFINKRYGNVAAKEVVPARKITEEEENLFEADFKKLMQKPELQEEFKKKKMEAAKINLSRKTKEKKGK